MRTLVNGAAQWFWDGVDNGDAFTQVGRFSLAIIGLFVAAAFVLVVIGSLVILAIGPDQPHLFCASGTELHSTPSTEMVGKVSEDGVRYTCR